MDARGKPCPQPVGVEVPAIPQDQGGASPQPAVQMAPRPTQTVVLTTEGSTLLEDLQDLAHEGIEILSCGTCLDYYKLKEKLEIGTVSNMFEIVSFMADADRVLRP